ncbi:hypothetical protein [Streptodolium elevatio]|uniref:Uncharacterized protein n=1 Tax=Streptodolium elevatio TaxID=3157996 RepID=A0ABV3DS03_9ACTN
MSVCEPVSRSSLKRLEPIAAPSPMPVLPSRTWSDQDWERIQLGYRAQSMDEKWNVFAEDELVYLHRSWTGFGVFEATFAPVEGRGRRIVSAVVERDQDRYASTDDERDLVVLELVLSTIVLGEPAQELRTRLVELTRQRAGSEVNGALVQHSMLGARSER